MPLQEGSEAGDIDNLLHAYADILDNMHDPRNHVIMEQTLDIFAGRPGSASSCDTVDLVTAGTGAAVRGIGAAPSRRCLFASYPQPDPYYSVDGTWQYAERAGCCSAQGASAAGRGAEGCAQESAWGGGGPPGGCDAAGARQQTSKGKALQLRGGTAGSRAGLLDPESWPARPGGQGDASSRQSSVSSRASSRHSDSRQRSPWDGPYASGRQAADASAHAHSRNSELHSTHLRGLTQPPPGLAALASVKPDVVELLQLMQAQAAETRVPGTEALVGHASSMHVGSAHQLSAPEWQGSRVFGQAQCDREGGAVLRTSTRGAKGPSAEPWHGLSREGAVARPIALSAAPADVLGSHPRVADTTLQAPAGERVVPEGQRPVPSEALCDPTAAASAAAARTPGSGAAGALLQAHSVAARAIMCPENSDAAAQSQPQEATAPLPGAPEARSGGPNSATHQSPRSACMRAEGLSTSGSVRGAEQHSQTPNQGETRSVFVASTMVPVLAARGCKAPAAARDTEAPACSAPLRSAQTRTPEPLGQPPAGYDRPHSTTATPHALQTVPSLCSSSGDRAQVVWENLRVERPHCPGALPGASAGGMRSSLQLPTALRLGRRRVTGPLICAHSLTRCAAEPDARGGGFPAIVTPAQSGRRRNTYDAAGQTEALRLPLIRPRRASMVYA